MSLILWRWLFKYIMMNLYKLKDWTFHNSKNFIDIHILVYEKFLIPWYQIAHNISTWKNFHGFITWIDILVLKPNKKIDKYRFFWIIMKQLDIIVAFTIIIHGFFY
jgi:hypothetical protein